MQSYKVHAYVISMEFSAVNRRRPSRETPLEPGAKKDGSFRRLCTVCRHQSKGMFALFGVFVYDNFCFLSLTDSLSCKLVNLNFGQHVLI